MEQSDKGSVYVVVVSGKLKPGQMDQFVDNFKPLAQHVTEEEEGTLTYQLSTGGDDPDRLCIYERSVSVKGSACMENVMARSPPDHDLKHVLIPPSGTFLKTILRLSIGSRSHSSRSAIMM